MCRFYSFLYVGIHIVCTTKTSYNVDIVVGIAYRLNLKKCPVEVDKGADVEKEQVHEKKMESPNNTRRRQHEKQ